MLSRTWPTVMVWHGGFECARCGQSGWKPRGYRMRARADRFNSRHSSRQTDRSRRDTIDRMRVFMFLHSDIQACSEKRFRLEIFAASANEKNRWPSILLSLAFFLRSVGSHDTYFGYKYILEAYGRSMSSLKRLFTLVLNRGQNILDKLSRG